MKNIYFFLFLRQIGRQCLFRRAFDIRPREEISLSAAKYSVAHTDVFFFLHEKNPPEFRAEFTQIKKYDISSFKFPKSKSQKY